MRYELVTPETIQVRESQGLVKDIYDPSVRVREPLSEYRTMLDLIHSDVTLATAYDIIIEFVTYRGFDFIGGTKAKRDKFRKLFAEMNVKPVLANLAYQMCYYGDAYMELRKDNSDTINELWPLETTEMRIIYDIHGKVTGYVQRPFGLEGLSEKEVKEKEGTVDKPVMGIFFKPDEVIHFRMKWIGSQVYSYNPNQPISTPASTSIYVGNYLMNIFINMPPRYVAHLAGISKAEYANAKGQFQSAKTNYKKTIAFSRSSDPNSKLDIKKLDPPYDKELIAIKKYLNNEVLKITRVPRTWVEESGVENRGVGESIQLPFQVHISYMHGNIFEPGLNLQLIKQMDSDGKDDKEKKSDESEGRPFALKFNEISRKGELEILTNAGLIKNFGAKPEALVRYLDERGILGFDPDDFETEQEGVPEAAMPSRQRMNKATQNMTQKRNESGVSKTSGKKMGIA